MIPLGLWIGIVGYGILYAGVLKLGGGTCSLAQAFTGTCTPAGSSSQSSKTPSTSSASGLSSTALPATAGASTGNFTP